MLGLGVFASAFSLPVTAQVLEEIVVTAKQREQNLQEVPLSISVFNEQAMENRGIENVQDVAAFTPNFNIYSGNSRQDASAINVRGLSPNTSDERYQPVSFFVDGIYMGGITVGLQLIDVERVEVIKGPQSATFGRATYAGAIDFVTKTPSLESWGGKLRADFSTYSGDASNQLISGYVAGPIVEDRVSASLFVQQQSRGGFDQAPGAQFGEVGEEETTSVNAVLYAQITDRTSLKIRGIFSDEDDQEAMYHTTQPLYWQQQGSNIITLPSGALFISGDVPDPIRDGIRGVDITDPTIASPSDSGYERERTFFSAILEHEFANGYQLSYRGSYMDMNYDAFVDFRGRTLVGTDPIFGSAQPTQPGESVFNFRFPFPFQEEFKEHSSQVRLLSPDDQRFQWSVGGYFYESRDSNFQQRTDLPAPAGNPARQTRGDEEIDNIAVFGSLAFDINDQWNVSLEGRWQEEEVLFEGLQSAVSSGSRFAGILSEKDTNFEPRVTLSYKPNDNHMIYGMYSKGVKSGRWNTSTAAPAVGGLRPTAGYIFAPPEELQNWELGSKSTLLDGRATLNAAVFFQNVKDQQLRQSVQIAEDLNGDGIPDVLNAIFTAGDSEIFGFELEGVLQVTDDLLLTGAIGYADHEFTDDITPSADFDLFDFVGGRSLKGKTSVNVPDVTANLSAQYNRPVGQFDWMLRGDVIYTGSKYVELANIAEIPAYALFNLRSTLRNDNWGVSLYVNNVFDDETAQGAGLTGTSFCEFERNGPNLPAFNAAQRCIYLVPQRGREVGLNLTFEF